jgi:hypothetical protein
VSAAPGASVTGSVSGAIAGDTLALNSSGVTLAYNSPHVVSATTIAASGTEGFTITSSSAGSLASDYSFTAPSIASVAGTITPAQVQLMLGLRSRWETEAVLRRAEAYHD